MLFDVDGTGAAVTGGVGTTAIGARLEGAAAGVIAVSGVAGLWFDFDVDFLLLDGRE